MHEQRREGWRFNPVSTPNPFFRRHEPVVDRWLAALEEAGDPWWQSAEHAAYCWLSSRDFAAHTHRREASWDDLSIAEFLFSDLSEGGTVASFGSVEIFFEHLVEAFRRFLDAGLIPADRGRTWLGELLAARKDFLRFYDDDTTEREAHGIRRRYLPNRRAWVE